MTFAERLVRIALSERRIEISICNGEIMLAHCAKTAKIDAAQAYRENADADELLTNALLKLKEARL
jgi:hypothetical protein